MTDAEVSLQNLLRFSEADLAANKDGRLGPGQVPRLVWSGVWRLVAGPALLIGSLAIAVSVLDVPFLSVFLLLFTAIGLFLSWTGFAFLVDAIDGQVAFVTGPLKTRIVRGKTTSYYADCGPVSKLINSRAYDGLPRGLTCHLYYAPGARSLLSIEPASESEPKPGHPFGPDSAHVWDRLRWSWVAITVGLLGLLVAAHGIAIAHPAHPVPVEGTVARYVETHGKSTYRDLYLQGDPDSYRPYVEDAYSPPMPPFDTLTGRNVVLYVNQGTRDVLAINDGEQLHASDWYLQPDLEKKAETDIAITAGIISFLAVAGGVAGILFGGRLSRSGTVPQAAAADSAYAQTPMYAMPSLYAPPSVRPWHANWVVVPVLALAGAAIGLVIAVSTHT